MEQGLVGGCEAGPSRRLVNGSLSDACECTSIRHRMLVNVSLSDACECLSIGRL